MFIHLRRTKKKKLFVLSQETPQERKESLNSDSNYFTLCKKYGEPRRNALDGEPSVNSYGIATFPNGKQFVQDCVTGDVLERTSEVRYLGSQNDLHFYVGPKSKYTDSVEAIPSFAGETNG